MAENCSYEYRGKTYSTDRLKRLLVEELPSKSQEESVQFLVDYLGMNRDEILVVKGLIDNRSLGRFIKDGNILLSDLANPDVAYHEAFHRVWRMYLSSEDRLMAIKEAKKRKGIQSLIESYRSAYPKLSENDLIEELLADEFSDYTLNQNFKVEQPIKSLFQRFLNFLKKLLGLKIQNIQMIYDKILSKDFKNAPKSVNQYMKDADKVLIEGYEFSVEEKNELISIMTQRFVQAMLKNNGEVDLFLRKPTVKIKKLIEEYVTNDMLSIIIDTNENADDLITAVYQDVEKWTTSNNVEDSIFISGMVQNLNLLGLNIKDDVEDASEGALEDSEKQAREFQPSLEFDPKAKMGKKIKLLLSSLTESELTPNFKFPKPLSWTKGFIQIGTRMAGIPTSVFMSELAKLDLSYVQELSDFLNKDLNFRNKFISTMAMTENKFLIMNYKGDDIYFLDANSGSKKDKIVGEWQNQLIRNTEDWESWLNQVKIFQSRLNKVSNQDILDHFGITVNPAIENLQQDLHVLVNKAASYKGEKPESKKLFDDLNIGGYISKLATKQSAFEDTVDTMVNLGGVKVYTLGLNTQQTTVINGIKYAQSLFTPEMTQSEKIDLLRIYAPFQVSEFNVTKLSNGEYLVHNKWLDNILNGERLDLMIPYQVKTEDGDQSDVAKLDEADLMSLHVNGALQGVTMSQKHADRSTFFAYTFGLNKPLYSKSQTPNIGETLEILVKNIKEQIELEAKFTRKMRSRNLPIQYLGKAYEDLAFASLIGKEVFEEVVAGGKITNLQPIRDLVEKQFKVFQDDVTSYGMLETYQEPLYKEGKRDGFTTRIKGLNNSIVNNYGSVNLTLAVAFVNEVSSHLFETRFFSGDVRAFKNGNDLFKRMAPQSSTGNLSVNDTVTHEFVREKLNQDFQILNPKTGEIEIVNPSKLIGDNKDKYFRSVTLAERENYKSHLLESAISATGKALVSKLTGKQESKLFMLFEDGFVKDFPDTSIEELRKTYGPKLKLYEAKYATTNENDGISYMTLPAFKKFMLKQGNWTDGMEMVFQTEMKIANLRSAADIANIEITFKGVTFKPFEVKPETINGKKYDGFKQRVVDGKLIKADAVHTLKTQFGGYSTPEEYFDQSQGELEYLFNSVYKTSQHLLLPSAVIGTNLQLMNFSLLSNGIDIAHMGSANKVGGVDPKLAAQNIINNNDDIRNTREFLSDISERGLDFYDRDGFFNHDALTKNLDVLSYLSEWDYLKDQVAIGNKVKNEIKGSTQSLKIMLSNLIVNGQERFESAQELVNQYKEVVREIVQNNHDNLLKKIGYDIDIQGFDSFDKLKKSVLESSQMKAAPENIRNSVENFFSDPDLGLEGVPMKNKIENVLFSLITNGIISFDRPGSSYPQTAPTGYEALGSRKFNEDGTQRSNQDTLKFYNPIFDDDGNITKMEAAEVIMPLPDYWIKPLLRWAKTNNLAKALDKLNADIELRPELYEFKGLRIPNQQLSSNDIFRVKRFNLPTMQNYIVIPSEMVVKSGGDS